MRPEFDLHAEIRESGYSRPHFYRCFTRHFGVTPEVYVRESRLRLAVKFLSGEPTMPVGDVAGLCGYANQTLFNRHFKRMFGVPPTQYRKGQSHTA
jgi:AraC-like DNA-binding protein